MARVSAAWPVAGILTGVLLLAGGAVPAEAKNWRHGAMGSEERLGLSDDQVRALHEAHEQQWEARRQLRRSLMSTRRSLNELIMQGGDDTAIQAKKAELQQFMAQGLDLRVKAMQDLARILTPEQRTRFLQRRFRSDVELPAAG